MTYVDSKTIFLGTAVLLLAGCWNHNPEQQQRYYEMASDTVAYTVEESPEWTALFKRNSGWFGGDGIFAIPLHGVEKPGSADSTISMVVFSDTMIGEIVDGELQDGFSMVNNSVAYLEGGDPNAENIDFRWKQDSEGNPETFFVPDTEVSEEDDYYWLGDGFANQEKGGDIYLFAYRVRHTGEGAFPFKVVGNPMIVIPAGSSPPFEDHRQVVTSLYMEGENETAAGTFGAGIFVNTEWAGAPDPDGYVYIYGVKGPNKQLVAARVKPESIEGFDKWRFWDGSSWNPDKDAVHEITDRVSNELSVYPIADDKYVLVFQVGGAGSGKVGIRIGETPVGPFGEIEVIYTTPEAEKDSTFYTYNAKAHPNISQPGELLISYNVNSFSFSEKITEFPHLYRPRFIRLRFIDK